LSRFIAFLIILLSAYAGSEEFVSVDKTEILNDDFYASGSVIEISGVCKKDVYLAGTQILIDGIIEGDLICLAGSLQITGTINGSLRGVVGQTLIAGEIKKNVTLASAAFTSTQDSSFDSNVFLAASTVDMRGKFLKDLFLGASNLRFNGNILNNIHAYTGYIKINSNAHVGGYLEFSSPHPIDIQEGAKIDGDLIEKKGPSKIYSKSVLFNNLILGSKLAAVLMNLMFTMLIGVLLIKIWPNVFVRSLGNLKRHLFKSFIQGTIFIFAVPLIGLILLITILGIPIAVTLIAFSVLGLYTAKIHVLFYLADVAKHKFMRSWGLISLYSLMCIFYFTLQLIPYLNTGLSWIFTLMGLGASIYLPKAIKKV
jgi:hypothetical protein